MRTIALFALLAVAAAANPAVAQSSNKRSTLVAGGMLQLAQVQSSKLSAFGVLQSTAAQASKLVGYAVLQSMASPSGVLVRAPLTHW